MGIVYESEFVKKVFYKVYRDFNKYCMCIKKFQKFSNNNEKKNIYFTENFGSLKFSLVLKFNYKTNIRKFTSSI